MIRTLCIALVGGAFFAATAYAQDAKIAKGAQVSNCLTGDAFDRSSQPGAEKCVDDNIVRILEDTAA